MSRRNREKRRRKVLEQPKRRRWWLLGLAGLGLAAAPAIYHAVRRYEPVAETRADAREAGIRKMSIPEAKIVFETEPKHIRDADFDKIHSILVSSLKKSPLAKGYYIGSSDELLKDFGSIKKKLERAGYRITANAREPREIFDALSAYFERNNFWLGIRTATRSYQESGKREKVKILFIFEIRKKEFLTFDFFGGKISGNKISVYTLDADGRKSDFGGEGFTTKRGIVLFGKGIEASGMPLEEIAYDCALHEAVHFHSYRVEKVPVGEEFDLDLMNDSKLDVRRQAMDELRAFLVGIIYGKHPAEGMLSLMSANMPQYDYAKVAASGSFRRALREDPEKFRRYASGRLKIEELTPDEIRQLAYRAYLENFPNRR